VRAKDLLHSFGVKKRTLGREKRHDDDDDAASRHHILHPARVMFLQGSCGVIW